MKIALLGDIALIGRYDRMVDNIVEQRVEYIRKLVSDCDFVIANQESVLTNQTRTTQCKGVYLRSAEENVKTLQYMCVTHVTLANNHIYDYGTQGRKDAEKVLKEAGILSVGLCGEPAILEKDGEKAMLDGFCCLSANALRYGNQNGNVQLLTYDSVEKFLKEAENARCLPIVSAHFGIEGLHYPALEHVRMFRALAEKHRFVLHGNHPHAMQGYERCGDSLLVYAQGNLCFDECTETSIHEVNQETEETRKGYVVILEIIGNAIQSVKAIPITDLGDGILRENSSAQAELERYCAALKIPENELAKLRQQECADQSANRAKRNPAFYLHRLNYRYIGAFVNGQIHAAKYSRVMLKQWGQKK